MPTTCRLIDVHTVTRRCECGGLNCPQYLYQDLVDRATDRAPVIGDMWYRSRDEFHPKFLSPQYWATHAAAREPLMVVLPTGRHFCLDQCYQLPNGTPMAEGWQVSGTAPLITVRPSIHMLKGWHGYLTDGILSDHLG